MDLKPCPFCGSEHVNNEYLDGHTSDYVTCAACECDGPMGKNPEDGIRLWNTRTPQWISVDGIKEVRASLEACIVFSPRDWSLVSRDAWLYGIVVGWEEDAMVELKEKHGWNTESVNRLKRLCNYLQTLPEPPQEGE